MNIDTTLCRRRSPHQLRSMTRERIPALAVRSPLAIRPRFRPPSLTRRQWRGADSGFQDACRPQDPRRLRQRVQLLHRARRPWTSSLRAGRNRYLPCSDARRCGHARARARRHRPGRLPGCGYRPRSTRDALAREDGYRARARLVSGAAKRHAHARRRAPRTRRGACAVICTCVCNRDRTRSCAR